MTGRACRRGGRIYWQLSEIRIRESEPFVIDELSVSVTLDKHYDEEGEVIDDDWMTTVTVNINDNEVDVDYD